MDFSIIIASFDRPESLDRLLTGLAEYFVKSSIDFEILLANNARGDDAGRQLDADIEKFTAILSGRVRRI